MSINVGCSGRVDCTGLCQDCDFLKMDVYEEPCISCEHNPDIEEGWEITGCHWKPKKEVNNGNK